MVGKGVGGRVDGSGGEGWGDSCVRGQRVGRGEAVGEGEAVKGASVVVFLVPCAMRNE